MSLGDPLPFHFDDLEWTFMGTDSAAFAVVIVYFGHVCGVKFDAGFGTVYPADLTARAFFSVYDRSERSPRASLACAGDAWT